MLLVNARVGPSRIHGLGLIAMEAIPKGTLVWRLDPAFDLLISREGLASLSRVARAQVLHYGYFDESLDKYVLCSDDDRFCNHSDNPNTTFLGDHAVAARDISPGEEITDSYLAFGKPIQSDYSIDTAA